MTGVAEVTEEIIRVSKFMLTGFLRPGNHTFRTFEHDCSTQILPEYSDLVLFLRFVCFFFFNVQKNKKNKKCYTLTFLFIEIQYIKAKIPPLSQELNSVHLVLLLLDFWMDGWMDGSDIY